MKTFTEEYCGYGHPRNIVVLAEEALKQQIQVVLKAANEVTLEYQSNNEKFRIKEWIGKFHYKLSGKLILDKREMSELGGYKELEDIEHYTKELIKGLNSIYDALRIEFQSLKAVNMQCWDSKPYDVITESLAGCTAKCPFCNEPCKHTWKGHSGDHTVDLHRPQCLSGYRNTNSWKMVLTVCSRSVDSNDTFNVAGLTNGYVPYRKYKDYYKTWYIKGNEFGEASFFWQYVVAKFGRQLSKLYSMDENSVPYAWDEVRLPQALNSL